MENLVQISIRSYLTMGTAAVVGAGAIALTPALPASGHIALPAPAVVDVSLTNTSFSLVDVVGLLGDTGLGGFSLSDIPNLFSGTALSGGDFSLSDIADLLGNSGLGGGALSDLLGLISGGTGGSNFSLTDIIDLFNGGGQSGGALSNILDLFNGGGLGVGSISDIFSLLNGGLADLLPGISADVVSAVVKEVVNEVRPLLTAAAGDVFNYAGSTFTGLFVGPDSIPAQIGAAVFGVPAVFKAVIAAAKAGDFGLALKTLSDGLIAPITAVGKALRAAVNGLKDFVAGQVQGLASALPSIVIAAVEKAIAGAGPANPAGSVVTLNAGTPTVSDAVEPVVADSVPAAAAARTTPRAAASVRAAAPAAAAASAESAVEAPVAEAAAPQAEAVAPPVTRPRAGAVRAAIADAVANGPSVTSRPKPTLRGDRGNTERPKAAAASRS